MTKSILTAFLATLTLSACGGSSNDDSASSNSGPIASTGIFVDSVVSGISYSTASQSGATNEIGEFKYFDGESVTFSIGSLSFPTVPAAQVVTPLDMSPSNSIEDNTTINIAVLLQSLDEDDNAENGISITGVASASATQLDFSVPPTDFSTNADVINLVANSGSSTTEVINIEDAIDHLGNSTSMPREDLFVENRGLQQMTSEELESVLDGNTVVWGDGSIVYYNGAVIQGITPDGTQLVGAINFANSLHCRSWNGGSDKCSTVYDDGSGILTFFVNGRPDSSGGYAQVYIGNREQF